MEYVRLCIWPRGGGPQSPHPKLQLPFCVIVEFEDVNLGEEKYVDENGKPARRPLSFFPTVIWA